MQQLSILTGYRSELNQGPLLSAPQEQVGCVEAITTYHHVVDGILRTENMLKFGFINLTSEGDSCKSDTCETTVPAFMEGALIQRHSAEKIEQVFLHLD